MKRRSISVAAAAVLAARRAAAQNAGEPIEMVRSWFEPRARAPEIGYSSRLEKLLREDTQRPEAIGGANLTVDWLINSREDAEISELRLETISLDATKARIRARFRRSGAPIERTISFTKEKGRWVIDEVALTSESTTLTAILLGE